MSARLHVGLGVVPRPRSGAGTGQRGDTVPSRRTVDPAVAANIALVAGVAVPLAVAAVLSPFRASLPATDAALCLVLVVVAVAAGGRRGGGYLAAFSAAAWFDFFFTAPYNTFDINSRANIETTVLLLAIGVAVTEIAVWGRRQHAEASKRAGYLDGIRAAAQSMASGDSPLALTEIVCRELSSLLALKSCQFQPGMAGVGSPARLQHDGRVTMPRQDWDADRDGLPAHADVELLAEAGGMLRGRFLMTALPGAHPTLEQRLVAVALADQVAAALASMRR